MEKEEKEETNDLIVEIIKICNIETFFYYKLNKLYYKYNRIL